MIHINSIISNPIPSCFVKNQLKICTNKGNGEAKFYFPKTRTLNDYLEFFNHYNPNNIYVFSNSNLIDYLNNPIIFNAYNSSNYGIKGPTINEFYRQNRLSFLSTLPNTIPFTLEPRDFLDSQGRYYIRSYDDIFYEIMRSIAIPKLTYLQIDKYLYDDCPSNLITYINGIPTYPYLYIFYLIV